jgi:hypothetical protein
MVSEEVRVGTAIAFILINRVVTEIHRVIAGAGGRTVGKVVDADLHAAARTGLGLGVSAEREQQKEGLAKTA